MNDLFGEKYYVEQVEEGAYTRPQLLEIRKKGVSQQWDNLVATIDIKLGKKTQEQADNDMWKDHQEFFE